MGLPGCPTFTDVRTSIASHVKFTHSNDDQVKLSKFMCHDTWTADKFYVTNLTPQQAMEHRRLFDAALEGAERGSPSKEPTSGKCKRPLKGKGKQPRKITQKSPDEELTSGSTTPEGTRTEYQESGTSSPESSEPREEASEKGGSEGGAVGSQAEEEPQERSHRKYPVRRGKPTVLLTPLKSLSLTHRHVSPLKVKKAIFSPSSMTLVGISRQKKASEKVKKAIKKHKIQK